MDPSTVRSALSEMAYLHVPDKDRSKSPSPADSLASSATDISTLPIHGRHGSDGENEPLTGRRVFLEPKSREYHQGLTKNLAFAIGAAALGSAFQHGYNTGVVNAPQKRCRSYEMIIMGRFFIGVNNGLNAGLAPLYLNEISPTQMRGAVGTIYQLTVTIAILVSNILGLGNLLGTDELWPVLFSFTIVPSILMLLTFPLCPESPKYILINQGKDVAAQQALTWLRGSLEVHDEMDEMRVEFEQIKMVPRVTLYEMVHNIGLRTPLIISMMMMLSQQLSGINAAIFFSTNIFLDAGLSNSEATRATIGVGVINTLMTLVSLVLVERAGRRTLHLIGLAGMACLTVVLTLCLALKDEIKELSYLSVGAVVGFVIMFATGPGSIPWFMVGELFGQGARPLATSLSVAVNWTANFVVGMTFLPLTGILGHYTFLIFTGFLIFFWIFTYRRVPETKGKSVEEIAAIFRQRAYQ
ncbi:solute carrier family 2, facilitated glucose transporter member 1-like isoform X8 [Varroa destructor]|uniref:Major facilitator superfamily (MFS) profile domain-containing protein n=1 Tax=Varroa destructor TaxID=109461 RepID=A0A7M7KKF2_VARDE|nr:solute carrier family 2, facilitated glucose transporter member 1-like isoform X8 [Varroa destructor]